MKKIININLSGRVIPIEDSAYEKLKGYIESLRRYFVKEEDRDEIINDIESRIAELMSEKIRKGATCITDADIDEIAASMGRPEDFAAADSEKEETSYQSGTQQQSTYTETKERRRMYRDSGDKFIGGVCSGIAAYLNIDPAIVRILFAITTFGGFGLGFVVYILLWIILPAKDIDGYSGKRLYRNPNDRVISGVAGGLAAYFNRETWVIRVVFAAPFLFSIFLNILNAITWHTDFGNFFPNIFFGSLGSTFILAYIILWIVLPEARSAHEQMEMRGEKVDVNSIRQNMKERVKEFNMKDRIKEWSEEVKETAENFGAKAKEFSNTKGKTFAKEASETARRGGSGLAHAIGVLFKVFFLFIAGTIAFALFVALMALLFGGIAWWPVNNFLWTSKWQQIYAWGTVIFFLVVPLIGFITWLVRRIVGVRSNTGVRSRSYLGWIFGCLWTIGWVAGTLFIISISNDFSEYEHTQDNVITTSQPANGKMIVVVSEAELEYTGRFGWLNDGGDGWDLSSDTMKLSFVDLDIDKSTDSLYHVSVRRYSFGKSPQDALNRANAFDYTVTSTDSVLDLANGFAINKDSKFRGQRVQVLIKVPVGKKIRFDESVKRKLNPAETRHRSYRTRRNNVEIIINDKITFWWRSDMDYIMQFDGQLKDSTGKTPLNVGYRFEDDWNNNDGQDVEKQQQKERLEERERKLNEKERELEEEDRRIKEEKRKQQATTLNKKSEATNGLIAGSPSPVFSMAEVFF